MGKMIVVLVLAAVVSVACRAENGPNVPSAVQRALAAKYNITEPTNWVVSEEGGTKVWCTRWKDADGAMREADFDASGNVVKTGRSVKIAELPKAVTDAVEKRFAHATVTEVTFFEGKATEYELRITDADAKKQLVIVSPDGSKLEAYGY